MNQPTFDNYAEDYENVLNRSLRISGDTTQEFSRRRVWWVKDFLISKKAASHTVLDYGCGTGNTLPHLHHLLKVDRLSGVDVSTESLEKASNQYGSVCQEFLTPGQLPQQPVDFAFSSCVYHHIPPDKRPQATRYIYDSLKPGGWLTIFEVTPWHPGALYIMKTCPFDAEAITLRPDETQNLLKHTGFIRIQCRFVFFFPKLMAPLRKLEPYLGRIPLGAQYAICAQKPT
jgi:SAM-dependent methyltransferase